ncbi:hypothetical protein V2I01_13840 [Micromonospora sp. BRA006-A]|nr:hypothetical protein [Micromonospora sp. BRA006-A]
MAGVPAGTATEAEVPPRALDRARGGALALAVGTGTAVGVGLGLRGDDEDGPAPKAAAGANGVTVTNAELTALLDRHSKALAAKDLDGYLAAFDPARKELITGQTQLFRNLAKLPLSVARYETVERQAAPPTPSGRASRSSSTSPSCTSWTASTGPRSPSGTAGRSSAPAGTRRSGSPL